MQMFKKNTVSCSNKDEDVTGAHLFVISSSNGLFAAAEQWQHQTHSSRRTQRTKRELTEAKVTDERESGEKEFAFSFFTTKGNGLMLSYITQLNQSEQQTEILAGRLWWHQRSFVEIFLLHLFFVVKYVILPLVRYTKL